MRSIQCLGTYSKFPQIIKCFKNEKIKTVKQFVSKSSYLNSQNEITEPKLDLDSSSGCSSGSSSVNLFKGELILDKKLKSNKIFSTYTNSYINKESEHILILCLKKINEYEKNKENIKISVFIYELQNLSKSKISFNVLKNIKTIQNFFDHINNNIHTASPSLLLSVAISYKNIKLNKYVYFKNILKNICNHIKVYKNNKLTKLLKNEDNDQNNKDDYKYTIQLLNKKKKNHKINMLNVYTNHLNNSALSYILHSYSSLFNISNYYLLYICKYILLNVGNLNYLDMLSLLYFINKSNIKITKSDILFCIANTSQTKNGGGKNEGGKNNTKLDNNIITQNEKIIIQNATQLNKSNIKYNEYKNTYIKILRTIIHLINKKTIFNENTNILILILYYYFKMNLIPIQIFYKLHYRIKKNIKNVDIKYISLYLYILSNIKFNLGFYKFIYKYLTDVFTNRTKEFNILSLSLSFYSLSKNEYYDDKFVNSCLTLFKRYVYAK
ncbi:heptatricopeptide repeat-containing protein [Plasmodium yoelii yoelii]|uniref:Heptatricopeptide repeat-containing protein n=1 Tax=Plasmodium yoelii yoelii TaxID=73239 RepID=A0AAE9WTC0_PLAYO|nr:heptatricopeptide repeat-containing protein [Plasmodium yoelii yoelii]